MKLERFHNTYAPEPNTGCWLWTGYLNTRSKYGVMSIENKKKFAHRVAYEIFKGEIPDNLCVCHKCDVRTCVNPDHLFLGTKTDNMQDCLSKGRFSIGSKHKNSKLNESEVLVIRDTYNNSNITQKELAKIYGVSQTTIRLVIEKKRWAYL